MVGRSEPQILEAAANLGGIPGCTRGPLLCSPWCPIIAIVRAITRDLVPLAAAFCPWLLSCLDQALLALGQLSRFSLWALAGSSLPPPISSYLFLLSTIASIFIISEITCHCLDRGRVGALQLRGSIMFIDTSCRMVYVHIHIYIHGSIM